MLQFHYIISAIVSLDKKVRLFFEGRVCFLEGNVATLLFYQIYESHFVLLLKVHLNLETFMKWCF